MIVYKKSYATTTHKTLTRTYNRRRMLLTLQPGKTRQSATASMPSVCLSPSPSLFISLINKFVASQPASWLVLRLLGALSARSRATRVVLVAQLVVDLAQQVLGEGAQQVPRQVQGLEHAPVLIGALRDELALELLHELDEEVVLQRQRLLAHHGLHGHHVLAAGV